MKWLSLVFMSFLIILLTYVLDTNIGIIPPMGKLFSPFHGFWYNALQGNTLECRNLSLSGIREEVRVVFDKRHVAHIRARNDEDLYFAQGYITAQDRLWQMEIQTHAAAGRLSEFLGKDFLEEDFVRRRLGMLYAAERGLEHMQKDAKTRRILDAYTRGVNAYIEGLNAREYPLEYKLLNYAPEPWTPLKAVLVLKYMAWRLSVKTLDLPMTRLLQRYGKAVVDELFSSQEGAGDFVIPEDTPWDFTTPALTVPQEPFLSRYGQWPYRVEKKPDEGSNNWAVSGKKSATGFPLLASDPHLLLTLPSIWYEVQLISPSQNVYGVSIPGAPCILIGFNENIAWGVTNAEIDVTDWYEIELRGKDADEYRYENEWRKTQKREEIIRVRGEKDIREIVVYTHHGPIAAKSLSESMQAYPYHAAFRWVGHDPSEELLAFFKINCANNYEEFVEALSHYDCPAQNFVFASRSGDIAMWQNGKIPLKWKNQGRFVLDGGKALYEWQGWVPHKHNPHVKNPGRGFVSSANQYGTAESYPYFLGEPRLEKYRNVRINQMLSEKNEITPDDFRKMQNDNKNLLAAFILPPLLASIEGAKLSAAEKEMKECLAAWNFQNDADKIAPTIWEEWWKRLHTRVWQKAFGKDARYVLFPDYDRTARLMLENPPSRWLDDPRTPQQETLLDHALPTFRATSQALVSQYGKISSAWAWGNHKGTRLAHLAKIPGLSSAPLFVGGGRSIVNATTKIAGPSWRMVVSLGPQVQAWGIYPGGQSGNPLSPQYDAFLATWVAGALDELLFLRPQNFETEERLCGWKMLPE